MKSLATLLAVLLLCGTAFGQYTADITIPEKVEVGNCVVVTCKTDAKFASIQVLAKNQFKVIESYALAPDAADPTVKQWNFTGLADQYLVTVILFDPEKGIVNKSGNCEITGGTKPPDPPQPPQPIGQKWQLLIVHQAGEKLASLPQSQRDLITSLQVRKEIASMGHVVRAIRDDNVLSGAAIKPENLQPFVNEIKKSGVSLPAIAMAPKDGGDVIVKPLPTDWAGLKTLLEGK